MPIITPPQYGFYLGAPEPDWLTRTDVPLFVARPRLLRRRRSAWGRARGRWAGDSGGFTQIATYGEWTVTEADYVADWRRWRDEIGGLDWIAPQDWMCEPSMLTRTGKTIAEHQRLTAENFVTLRMIAPELPFIPVLQGWRLDDYLRHVELYARMGVHLESERLTGLGSVCRRQHTAEAERIICRLSQAGIRLHGLGFKVQGLVRCADVLASSDSMAWSYRARREGKPMFPECEHRACHHCYRFAMTWRERLIAKIRIAQAEPRLFN